MKQIKVLKINQKNVNDKNEVCNVEDSNIIKEGTYNFFIRTLETYRKKEFEDEEKVTEFIKLILSKDEETAKKQWFDGVTYEGKLYKGWLATVNGIKQEDKYSKCEVIFLNEANKEFKNYFETIISLGKFNKINKIEDMYVNKKILSRLSLATSDLITEIDIPNIIILPTGTLEWKKDYKTVEPFTVKEIVKDKNDVDIEVEKIKYNLIDYTFDKEIDIFDGGGIATPQVMDSIGDKLDRNDVDFAIIRAFGLAIKGLITRFDIIKYLELMHSKLGNTDYCKKEDDKFYLLDMYGDWREVTDNTLLLNESMVKLADLFEKKDDENTYGMEEYKTLLEEYNNEKDIDIYNILNKLYITKVNKKDVELKEYRRLNYQLFNALALTTKEYNDLAQEDFRLFKKLLKPYSHDAEHKEFKENIDTINIFYNQLVDYVEDINDIDEAIEGDVDEQEDDLKEITNCVDKCNALINLNQKNIHLAFVKKNLAKMIEKKIRDMANGRVTVKASYNYMAIDPISYMNFAITREQGSNGLAEWQFYCNSIADGETRTIFRNPCMAYSEIHNVTFIKNNFFDNWLCKSGEIVYFNQKSDIQNLIGSADFDGDCVNLVDNEIIKNAVVVPQDGKYFCFTEDGEKKKCKFDDEGRFLATYKPSGNLIGSIATLATSVNNDSQTLPTYYRVDNNKFKTTKAIKDLMEKKNIDGVNEEKDINKKWELFDKLIKQLIKNNNLGYSNNAPIEIQREKLKQQFYENEKNIYSLLHCSSLVIDSPKTMNIIDAKAYTQEVTEQYEVGEKGKERIIQPLFLQYKKKLYEVKSNLYSNRHISTLDNFAKKVEDNLLNIIEKRKHSFSNNSKLLIAELEKAKEYNKDDANILWDILVNMHNEYSEKWDIANKLTGKDKGREFNKIEAEYTLIANEIMDTYDLLTIAKVLSTIEDIKERFVICFFFPCLNAVDKLNPSLKSFYYKDINGDIKYMYGSYSKVEKAVNLSDEAIEKLNIADRVKLKLETELRFGGTEEKILEVTNNIKIGLEKDGYYNLEISEDLNVFDNYKKALGDKTIVKIKQFMIKKDGTNAIAKKSFGVVIENVA